MKFGLSIFPVKLDQLGRTTMLAEELGYHSVWYGEHVALPKEFEQKDYPGGKPSFTPDAPFLDPFTLFAYLAALTKTIRMGSGVVILPLRDPLLTARSLIAADILSNGRINLGVGVGWMKFEYDITGRKFEKRGEILDEFLDVLDACWRDDAVEFHGKHFNFPPISFTPKPVQKPRIPVHIGGMSSVALKRAARYDGWYGLVNGPEQAKAMRDEIETHRQAIGKAGQPFEMICLFLRRAVDPAEIEAFERAGVDELVVTPWKDWSDPDEALASIVDYAAAVGLKR